MQVPMRLGYPFSDHAVLQQGRTIPVWGACMPHMTITVLLAGHRAIATSTADGSWLVRFPSISAGGPHELVATCAIGEVRCRDVWIGEVWLCSGQSNMEWILKNTHHEIPDNDLDISSIRCLRVSGPACFGRQSTAEGNWEVATAQSLLRMSAVGVWFAWNLKVHLGTPIGLIVNAWGGTRIQSWISREALYQDPSGNVEVQSYESLVSHPDAISPAMALSHWEAEAMELGSINNGIRWGWNAIAYDDQCWPGMSLPSSWQEHHHPESGVFWFRREVILPPSWVGFELDLHLGAIDKHDDTYVNGIRVGGLSWEDGSQTWNTPRVYRILSSVVVNERLVIAVRVRSHLYNGGLVGPANAMYLVRADADDVRVALDGAWKYQRETSWGLRMGTGEMPFPGSPNSPFTLFDSRVAPLLPYALRGILWYQGEQNVFEASDYRRLLPLLIADWRRAFGQGELPFGIVQLANYLHPSTQTGPSPWAELREAQLFTALSQSSVGLAVAIDVGDAKDIHPRDKRSVGERLARWALAAVYSQGGLPSGPSFRSLAIEPGGVLRCSFYFGNGLRTKDGSQARHVFIAGYNRQFHPALTRIDGDSLLVWSPIVPQPVAVRYAWADNPVGCHLENSAGLPASPFRSDCW